MKTTFTILSIILSTFALAEVPEDEYAKCNKIEATAEYIMLGRQDYPDMHKQLDIAGKETDPEDRAIAIDLVEKAYEVPRVVGLPYGSKALVRMDRREVANEFKSIVYRDCRKAIKAATHQKQEK